MSERAKFIVEWERCWRAQGGRVDVAELCRLAGVSRQTGYVWIRQYQEAGRDLRVLEDRSRRPHTDSARDATRRGGSRRRDAEAVPEVGAADLRRMLVDRHPRVAIPGATTIAAMLRRRGMATPRGLRRRARGARVLVAPFADCAAANDVWCMDFKGWFRTGDQEKCYPFTLVQLSAGDGVCFEALYDGAGVVRSDAVRFDARAE